VNATALEEQAKDGVGETPTAGARGGDAEDEAHVAELESVLLAANLPDNEADTNVAPAETNCPSVAAAEAEV
jgi:hypothetical protein